MKIALVSRGPATIGLFPGRAGYDAVVAVNSAAERVEADVWAVTDMEVYAEECHHERPGHPRPAVRTVREMDDFVNRRGDAGVKRAWYLRDRNRALLTDVMNAAMPEFPESVPRSGLGHARWAKLGGTFGLGVCWYLLTQSDQHTGLVECYGVDFGGGPSIGGYEAPEARWTLEKKIWWGMCEAFEREGLLVRLARLVPWQIERNRA